MQAQGAHAIARDDGWHGDTLCATIGSDGWLLGTYPAVAVGRGHGPVVGRAAMERRYRERWTRVGYPERSIASPCLRTVHGVVLGQPCATDWDGPHAKVRFYRRKLFMRRISQPQFHSPQLPPVKKQPVATKQATDDSDLYGAPAADDPPVDTAVRVTVQEGNIPAHLHNPSGSPQGLDLAALEEEAAGLQRLMDTHEHREALAREICNKDLKSLLSQVNGHQITPPPLRQLPAHSFFQVLFHSPGQICENRDLGVKGCWDARLDNGFAGKVELQLNVKGRWETVVIALDGLLASKECRVISIAGSPEAQQELCALGLLALD